MRFAGVDWRKFPKAFAFVVGVAAVAFAAVVKPTMPHLGWLRFGL